ncbi:hypothetical protein PHET_12303 [Paragonimus heterotremus]|uniref:Uncharacterized protein n=1 Tax=Paragonimus heterotremus TaxID=100268 RepID=A0A8J4T7N3_9TREM|nr:hypothetical protein PHET_12303 [Paragonimus heterotremus]
MFHANKVHSSRIHDCNCLVATRLSQFGHRNVRMHNKRGDKFSRAMFASFLTLPVSNLSFIINSISSRANTCYQI